MHPLTSIYSDLRASRQFIWERKSRILLIFFFFSLLIGLTAFIPELAPIVFAAALILPQRLLFRLAADFSEADYERFSPIIANIADYRFLIISLTLLSLPAYYGLFDVNSAWFDIGSMQFIVVACSIGVLVWSESLYEKNYHFGQWHIVERGLLAVLGPLSLVKPAFMPAFLLVYEVIINQFQYPGIGSFNVTHSRLPHTVLIITSAFAFVAPIMDVQSHHLLFLLFCGYAAHYFHPGLAKLRNGPLYYICHNNPVSMFLNAHQIGWLSSIEEETVLRIGQLTERIKPILNIIVVLIETGTIFVLLSPQIATVIVLLTILLHLLIFASTGDNFWKWVAVDISIVVGLVFVVDQPPIIFTDLFWLVLSAIFIVFASAWMNPASMDWLDVPYVELFRFEGDLRDGKRNVPIHSNVFRPYDSITTQGITGTLTFLGENPRITYSHGAITEEENKPLHDRLRDSILSDPVDDEEATYLVEKCGVERYDEEKTKRMEMFIDRFVRSKREKNSRLFRYFTSPREFYSAGLSGRESSRIVPELETVRIYRVDGIWTNEGFQELSRKEVVSVDV